MDPSPRSRLTVALAVAAIVATVALLIAGAVLAPSGEEAEVETETPTTVPVEDEAAAAAPTTTTTAPQHADHGDVVVETATADESHLQHAPEPGAGDHSTPHVAPAGHQNAVESHAGHVVAAPTTPGTTVVEHHADHVAPPTTTTTAVPALSAAAQDLLARTAAALATLPDVAAVAGAGYAPVDDEVGGYQHHVADPYLDDGFELDAEHIESILVRDGVVVAAEYVLSPGATLADAPAFGEWRDHDERCREGDRVVGFARADGSCARGQVRLGPPRLLVWLVPTACGPFAPVGSCEA